MKTIVRYIVGYILNDDYSDPVSSSYRIYDCKEDVRNAAKYRLRSILKSEGKMAEYKNLVQCLEECDHVCIQNISGGWAGNTAAVKIAEVYKR